MTLLAQGQLQIMLWNSFGTLSFSVGLWGCNPARNELGVSSTDDWRKISPIACGSANILRAEIADMCVIKCKGTKDACQENIDLEGA